MGMNNFMGILVRGTAFAAELGVWVAVLSTESLRCRLYLHGSFPTR
jgi:hypothetical protein